MKALIQRVSSASVTVDSEEIASIGPGMLILLGIMAGDTSEAAESLAERCANLRIFADKDGKMNLSIADSGGAALVVSQFTLCADTSRGRRPSYARAAPASDAEPLYHRFCRELEYLGTPVLTGEFGKMMQVALVNDGPVTLLLDDRR